jgi:predicted transcriptional regulator
VSRSRINVYLERDHDKRLAELCAMRGLSRSAVVAAALASFLSPEGADRREAAIARRLDKLTQQFDRLGRDQTILIETIALFVRYQLSVTSSIPEAHQEAARAQGRARFQQFVEQLARHLQRGNSLVKDLSEEISPTEEQFYSDTASSHASGAAAT